jgi:hypothetical protein
MDRDPAQPERHGRQGRKPGILADPAQARGGVEEDDRFPAGIRLDAADLPGQFKQPAIIGDPHQALPRAVYGNAHYVLDESVIFLTQRRKAAKDFFINAG